MRLSSVAILSAAGLAAAAGLVHAPAQQAAPAAPATTVTRADYTRAARYLGADLNPLIYRSGVAPEWVANDADSRFTYYESNGPGNDGAYWVVDPAKGTREPAFNHAGLAAALTAANAGAGIDAQHLPQNISFSADLQTVTVPTAASGTFRCELTTLHCEAAAGAEPGRGRGGRGGAGGRGGGGRGGASATSPDGKWTVALAGDEQNLVLRGNGETIQITSDGLKDFGYATDNAGWTNSNNAIVLWSPDSKKIATYQQDQRQDGDMYLVSTPDIAHTGHPELKAWKYPLPGDKNVTTIDRVIIDVSDPAHAKVIRLQMPADQHRSTTSDNLAWGLNQDVQWSADSSHLAFVSTSRDHKEEWVRVADATTGAVRDVYHETSATQFQGTQGGFRYLPASNEFLWYSQRDNWGELYLYDLNTGQLKRQLTDGAGGDVSAVQRVDEKNRMVYFSATGWEKGVDPYFTHFYKVSLDSGTQQLLTPSPAVHTLVWSPDYRYFIDSYSTPEQPPVSELRDANGKLVLPLEKADITRLTATGWKPPIAVTVKARDGVTDLYGLMFVPYTIEPGRKYPIINHIYPGPQTGSVGSRNFAAAHGDCDALAQLGFVVVELDGLGTPSRGKKFHDAYYGDMKDNTLPDQVAGMKELAQKYPYIDLTRVGIYGHSGGGDATADAMFRYGDFFKVGWSESGNHDQREYEDDWGERYQGLDTPTTDDNTTYTGQSNEEAAKNLTGHLMLVHGTMDNNVPPYNTLLVTDALIKANKDFDLLLLPNNPHGYLQPYADYVQRRKWDYFVRWLLNTEPPTGFEFAPPPAGGRGRGRGGR